MYFYKTELNIEFCRSFLFYTNLRYSHLKLVQLLSLSRWWSCFIWPAWWCNGCGEGDWIQTTFPSPTSQLWVTCWGLASWPWASDWFWWSVLLGLEFDTDTRTCTPWMYCSLYASGWKTLQSSLEIRKVKIKEYKRYVWCYIFLPQYCAHDGTHIYFVNNKLLCKKWFHLSTQKSVLCSINTFAIIHISAQ